MTLRADLLELTPEALTALANAGFVKRAQKEVAAAQVPQLEVGEDGAITALFDDGIRTQLPAGSTLRDARCNCQASTMCRHRVVLVLAYQAQHRHRHSGGAPAPEVPESPAPEPAAPGAAGVGSIAGAGLVSGAGGAEPPWEFWSPALFDDAALTNSFAPGVLAQAAKLAAERPVVTLHAASPGQPPGARLPMCSVQFFSRHSLAHARCDCKQGSGCAHVVVALWAFRQWENHAAPPGSASDASGSTVTRGQEFMVEVQPPDGTPAGSQSRSLMHSEAAQAALAQTAELLQNLWLDGSGQPLVALEARFEALRAQVNALGWSWVEDALDELWRLLQAQHARSSRFDARRLLTVLLELWARLHAAGHVDGAGQASAGLPASQIVGLGVKGEVALDHLRLVSLGAVLWADPDSEGADVVLADADTQTVTVLSRAWPRDNPATTGSALMNRRVAGFPLRQLAAGQVITKTARRSANGRIDIGPGTRQTGVMPLSPTSWDDLRPPLRQGSVSALIRQLQTDLPDFVKPRQAATGAAAGFGGALHLLDLDGMEVAAVYWDVAAQVLHAQLQAVVPLSEDGGDHNEAVDLVPDPPLYLVLPYRVEAPGAVDVLARALGGEWGPLRTIAGMVQLQAGCATMQPLALLTDQRGVVFQVEAAAPQPLNLERGHRQTAELFRLAADTLGLMTQWLRQGLRHQGGGMGARVQTQVGLLQQAGLHHCARLLGQVPGLLHSNARDSLPALLAGLGLLLQGVGR